MERTVMCIGNMCVDLDKIESDRVCEGGDCYVEEIEL